MAHPLVAIGLDSFSPILLEIWIEQGKLPVLARLMREGTYARQRNFELYRTENSWLTLLQGCSPEFSQEWGHLSYSGSDHEAVEHAVYAFDRIPPFYARNDCRFVVFDLPLVGVADGVKGTQLFGWGAEANQISRQSDPPGAIEQIVARHGRHPLYDTITRDDDGSERLSYRIPSIYDVEALRDVRDKLVAAIRTRTRIISELIAAGDWDCLICAFGEIHTAGHLLWHSSQIHPLRDAMGDTFDADLFLEIAQEIDAAVGKLLALLPPDANLIVFSPHGMRPNSIDLNSMLFLPEMVYRWSSGKQAFRGHGGLGPPPPLRLDYRRHWREEVWAMRTEHGDAVLESPFAQEARADPLDWDPANWYRPLWPSMRAFCLPGYSEGLVRVNVAGRDGAGGVPPAGFSAVCDELAAMIGELVVGRTGEKAVAEIIRVRAEADEGENFSPADLIVRWRDEIVSDVMEHPALGRVGPAPFFRAGGHATKGFVLGVGNSFRPDHKLADVMTEDVTATIVDRLGISPWPHMTGAAI